VFIDEIDLVEGDDAAADAEQVDNFKMFAGLGHDGVVGGDDEEDEIDAGGAGDHVADKALVARDVDDAEAATADFGEGEAEVDGHAARLFLGQAVGVDAGEGVDEGGLAVVDMAGGAEDEGTKHG
jgi:hypothetical protein